jgi:RimJ/RimL family protein N-acetyltransferase
MANEDQSARNMRPLLLQGSRIGLAVMHAEDAPIFARWYQDLAFTARLGLPGEVQTLEMRRQELEQNTRIKPNEICFSIVLLETGAVVGFGGLFDITRALTATLFIGIAP